MLELTRQNLIFVGLFVVALAGVVVLLSIVINRKLDCSKCDPKCPLGLLKRGVWIGEKGSTVSNLLFFVQNDVSEKCDSVFWEYDPGMQQIHGPVSITQKDGKLQISWYKDQILTAEYKDGDKSITWSGPIPGKKEILTIKWNLLLNVDN